MIQTDHAPRTCIERDCEATVLSECVKLKPADDNALLPRQGLALPPAYDLKCLTGLRFFAALSVVVYHFARPAMAGWPSPLTQLAGSGYAAVSFFFLLSGFILSYSYLNRSGELRGSRKDFYVARLARIYPAYFLAFLLAAPHNIWSSVHVNALSIAGIKLVSSAIALLSLQQAWIPWTAWCWNFPAWSVSVESFFYLVFPLLAPVLARLHLSTCLKLCGALWMVSLLAPSALILWKGTTAAPELNDHLQMFVEFNPLLRLPEFLIGVLLGRAFKLGLASRLPQRGLSFASLAAILVVLAFGSGIPHPLLANGLLIPLFACLIVGLSNDQGPLGYLLSRSPIVMLGEASYGIYILQIPVSYLLRTPPPHYSLPVFSVYLIVLIATSLLAWKFVESPLRNYARSRFMVGRSRRRELKESPVAWPQPNGLRQTADVN